MLREDIEQYTKLTGEDGTQVPIIKIGAYLDGYNKGLETLDKIIDMIDKSRCIVNSEYDQGRNYGLYMATEIISEYKNKNVNDELISKLKILKSEIEWDYPLEYQVVLDEVIKKLKEKENG